MATFAPVPDPGGAMDPPRRTPPTALAAPAFEPEPAGVHRPRAHRRPGLLRGVALAALEVADEAARVIQRVFRRAVDARD